MKKHLLFWILIALIAAIASGASRRLEIYLPRTVQVEGDVVQLGQVGIFHGPEDLTRRAETISLGRFSSPGQQIKLDRATIESCLAGSGISSRQIRLSGAEQIVVSRNESRLTGEQLIAAARAFLITQMTEPGVSILDPAQMPKDLVITESKPIEVVPAAGQDRISGKRTVVLLLRQNGLETGRIPIQFEVRFQSRQAVAVKDIAAGDTISKDLVRFETVETKEPQAVNPEMLFGSVAKRLIRAGTVINEDWLQPSAPPILVERRQKVILKIDTGLMQITAYGEAMDEGAVGQVIRVKRGQRPYERIILGTVKPDGTIEPLLGKGS